MPLPAEPSSPIPAALAPLADTDPLHPADPPRLLAYLAAIPDPRRASGRRHPLTAILAIAAAAVLTGARSVTAIAEWAAEAPPPVRAALGGRRDAPDRWTVPCEATIRRTLARVDATALAAVLGAWLADRDRPARQQRRHAVAVEGNQPTLLARCAAIPWQDVPVADRTRDRARDRAHGRIELRTLKAVTVGHVGFPHAAQVLQVTRKTRELGTRGWRVVVVYAITSLPFESASPARLADLLRGHWLIEALHHIRDTTFAEDASQLRSGSGPEVMACLRNLVIGALCRAGPVNLAAALRHHARDPRRPLVTLGITLG